MKVGIVGCGFVGSSAAYAMVLRGIASELALVDINTALASAQAEDILHAVPFSMPARVIAGGYSVLDGASVVILACGVGQVPGESRLHLLTRNAEVFWSVIPQVLAHAPNAVLVVASADVGVVFRCRDLGGHRCWSACRVPGQSIGSSVSPVCSGPVCSES